MTHIPSLSYWPEDTSEKLLERSVGDPLREAAAEAPGGPARKGVAQQKQRFVQHGRR